MTKDGVEVTKQGGKRSDIWGDKMKAKQIFLMILNVYTMFVSAIHYY